MTVGKNISRDPHLFANCPFNRETTAVNLGLDFFYPYSGSFFIWKLLLNLFLLHIPSLAIKEMYPGGKSTGTELLFGNR
jgi:hypothetical protein